MHDKLDLFVKDQELVFLARSVTRSGSSPAEAEPTVALRDASRSRGRHDRHQRRAAHPPAI
jgi:hypothetical protein